MTERSRRYAESVHLLESFVTACRAAGSTAGVVDLEGAAMDLLHRWGAPSRGYHDVEHLTEVLARLAELGVDDPAAVLAAWFHDAVYAGRPGEDERDSAELARRELAALGVPDAVLDRVAHLVLVTADHQPAAGDPVAAALCDADLAVLASSPERYRRYVAGVRSEYEHVDDETFRAGRSALLRALLERPRLYRTEEASRRWEDAARRNVQEEVSQLDAG
jgi:predicted metal-dependent HD superfamily phosphohydrolase